MSKNLTDSLDGVSMDTIQKITSMAATYRALYDHAIALEMKVAELEKKQEENFNYK